MKKLSLFLFFIFHFSFTQAQYLLYGTTAAGGVYNMGTIFSYNPVTDTEIVLFSFDGSDGNQPEGGTLLYATDSLLYASTQTGGTHGIGTVFSFNLKTNTERVVVNYDSSNGYTSNGGNDLMQAKNGLLYGTTWGGGTHGSGVLYSYNLSSGIDSVLFNFDSLVSGFGPYRALWEDTVSEILYGVTEGGGIYGGGVLHGFNILTNKDSVYVSFEYSTPWRVSSSLMMASNGLLYGMSQSGTLNDSGTLYTYDIGSGAMNVVFQFHGPMGHFQMEMDSFNYRMD